MKTYINTFICFLALSLIATSCHKDDNEDPTPIEEKDFQTVPYSFTATLTPMSDNPEGIELKKAFANGDVIEVTNAQILYEPLVLSCTEFNGKTAATFSGELKVKKDVDVASTLRLSAVLKNTNTKTLYNSGKPFTDVVEISNTTDGFDQYSYWSCANIVDNKIELTQSTVFVEVNMPLLGTVVNLTNGQAFDNPRLKGKHYYAVSNGTTVECKELLFKQKLDNKDKSFYKITATLSEDLIPALFSIGENQQVYFSRGNLQYRPMDGKWRLAPQQYHHCLKNTQDVGEDYAKWKEEDDWSDYFWFGAWVEGGSPNWAKENALLVDYQVPVDANGYVSGACAFGGAKWTLLTIDEWSYLLEKRANAKQKTGGAVIIIDQANNIKINGWVILPDDWVTPNNLKPFEGEFEVQYEKDIPNQYTIEEWSEMESSGAVFLPAIGQLFETIASLKGYAQYQSLTYSVNQDAGCGICFDAFSNYVLCYDWAILKQMGTPVRLVQKNVTATVKVE
ncbi:MAG: hypothetical protein J6Y24_15325 [Bacteroidales bacterium]|nr:hypothetical protein [Bacteroidales bacterium]